MAEEYRAKVFKSGNSLALRLPKALGLEEGQEMIVREERAGFTFAPAPSTVPRIDLSGIYGRGAGLRPLTTEDRGVELSDLDWKGKKLRRG